MQTYSLWVRLLGCVCVCMCVCMCVCVCFAAMWDILLYKTMEQNKE